MANITGKKVNLAIPPELLKAAKQRATEEGKTLTDWLIGLMQSELQAPQPQLTTALDWGRIDSRIDQRTAHLERQLEALSNRLEKLLSDPRVQRQSEERSLCSNSSMHS
ncbi:MAG: hypothetical protein F6K19_40265 [Cyanothece sp. SIO1E1]|nr:hypothetical protein [Cyanothece sp. SIO1E1]